MSLADKVAIVTGAARGIGRGCALALARAGAVVAVWDTDAEGAAETVELIAAEGGRADAYAGDAASSTEIARIVARIGDEFGQPSILVNNAAVAQFKPFLEIDEASLERICRNNLMGPFLLTQALIPGMVEAGWGRVINLGSAAAQQGTKTLSHYAAAKGGVMALTKVLAMEFAATGVTVNCISPSFIDTPMRLDAPVADFAAAVAATPMRRAGQPEDIAAAVLFLASEGAGYVTGQTMNVNGGLYLG